MKRSCPYCGRIHPTGYCCPRKPKPKRCGGDTQADKFRSSGIWQRKRVQIRERDNHLCQVCLRRIYNTIGRHYNFKDISVHHIEPLDERYDLRLDAGNLITLCAYHHSMAEDGLIPKGILLGIAQEQNAKASPRRSD